MNPRVRSDPQADSVLVRWPIDRHAPHILLKGSDTCALQNHYRNHKWLSQVKFKVKVKVLVGQGSHSAKSLSNYSSF